jgi:hypothetical protein
MHEVQRVVYYMLMHNLTILTLTSLAGRPRGPAGSDGVRGEHDSATRHRHVTP